jgi:hypothetical protein
MDILETFYFIGVTLNSCITANNIKERNLVNIAIRLKRHDAYSVFHSKDIYDSEIKHHSLRAWQLPLTTHRYHSNVSHTSSRIALKFPHFLLSHLTVSLFYLVDLYTLFILSRFRTQVKALIEEIDKVLSFRCRRFSLPRDSARLLANT